jgi:outer membrane receptor for ferrienterochelin and colicin
MRRRWLIAVFGSLHVLFILASSAGASIFGTVKLLVEDAQHRPVSGATLVLKAHASSFSQTGHTDDSGAFAFGAIPLGDYTVAASMSGFTSIETPLTVHSSWTPILRLQLQVAGVSQSVDVLAGPQAVASDSPTPSVLLSRDQIAKTPGAARSNSLSMITDYVPGSYMTHDQLHIRGGHQVTWLVDGVPVANTNIASNVGPQFDPRDIDYLEVQRGGYSAEYGDRTYGVFNVVPRTGFERDREAEATASFGNFMQTNDQVSIGDHSERLAYYVSANFSRSDYGLSAPTRSVFHDDAQGFGGFTSLMYNPSASDQLRLVANGRSDRYQIPNDTAAERAGIADEEREADKFLNLSWVHSFKPGALLTVSPFVHFNRADYLGGPADTPLIPQEKRSSTYAGAQVVLSVLKGQHDARAGFYGFHQSDDAFFGLESADPTGLNLQHEDKPTGNLEALFFEDQYRATGWLTLTAGVRLTYFAASLDENAASPRIGGTIRVPGLGWTVHGFYGRYYQAPPLSTISGPLLQFALGQGFGFLPLHGERDEEHQVGLTMPFKGWTLDTNYFRTGAKNFFDHNAINNSNIFFPITVDRARIRGLEVTLGSPRTWQFAEVAVAYALQHADGQGGVSGGLTNFSAPASNGYFPLDHDQRHTLNVSLRANLPARIYAAAIVHYGSGFSDSAQPPPAHLKGHALLDLSVGADLGASWGLAVHALNVSNESFLLDNSATFGGTHWSDPRQVYGEIRYRFRY